MFSWRNLLSPAMRRSKALYEDSMVELHGVNMVYANGYQALHEVELLVRKGEFVFLVGTTGSGKSSLLKLLYRENEPKSGSVYVDNQDVTELKRSEIPYLRRRLGVIFQDFRLLREKTAWENVAYALEVTGERRRHIPKKVARVLELVGLLEKRKRLPNQLSGGEQQRVAIARALVHEPHLLLADEPTGNLDPDSSWDIMQILSRINAEGTTVLVATHDQQIVDTMRKRVIVMQQGRIVEDLERGNYAVSQRAVAVS